MRSPRGVFALLALLSALFLPVFADVASAQTASCSGTAASAQTFTKAPVNASLFNAVFGGSGQAGLPLPSGATGVLVCWDTATPSNVKPQTDWYNAAGTGLSSQQGSSFLTQGTFSQAAVANAAFVRIDVAWFNSASSASVHIAADWTFPATATPTATSTPIPTDTPTATPIPPTSTPAPPTPTPAIAGCSNPGTTFDSAKGTQYGFGSDANEYQTCLNFAGLQQLDYQIATQTALNGVSLLSIATQIAIPTNTPIPTATPIPTPTADAIGCIPDNSNLYRTCQNVDNGVRVDAHGVYWLPVLAIIGLAGFALMIRRVSNA